MKVSINKKFLELSKPISISNRTFTGMDVITVSIEDGDFVGIGECSPQARYQQTSESCIQELEAAKGEIETGLVDRETLQTRLPANSARNALDCALWDLEAKKSSCDIWSLTGVAAKDSLQCDITIGLNSPEKMAADARAYNQVGMLKLKLGGEQDMACLKAVREAAPNCQIIVDVNEGWTIEQLQAFTPELEQYGVKMIEQPLPSEDDAALCEYTGSIPLCADESCHDRKSLDGLDGLYQFINIKLDKSGGLTEAIALAAEARLRGFKLMVGCMAGTSIAMAPAYVIATLCDVVDIDVPLHIKNDVEDGFVYRNGEMGIFSSKLWG